MLGIRNVWDDLTLFMTYIIRLFSLGIFFCIFTLQILTAADNLAVLEFLPLFYHLLGLLTLFALFPLRPSYLFRFYVSSYGSILEFECVWLFSEASEIINCKQPSQRVEKVKGGLGLSHAYSP